MAKEIKSWEANDGSLHKTACEAAARDLKLVIDASPCAENTPYAKTMHKWLTDEAETIIPVLQEYLAACPRPERATEGDIAGVTRKASLAEIDAQGHTQSCGVRASGLFWRCSCGALSTAQIEDYRRQGQGDMA